MKAGNLSHLAGGRAGSAFCAIGLMAFTLASSAFAQQPYAPPAYSPQQNPQPPNQQALLPPEQLDNLVAPIALYPDPLLGQVLAATTYPLEVVEASQWMQQNNNLRGQDLMNAARQQNWDPSVQALVAFPDVLTLLTRDVRWTTDLGNAFLAQQQDVMAAIQRMRARAQANGRLASTPQDVVTNQMQNGQNAVVIEPSNPDYIDVPEYNPEYVWGPPAYGYYPPLDYPPVAYGYGFAPGIYVAGFFPGWGIGFGGWGLGWGWGCSWWGGGLFLNARFFNHWGYHPYWGPRFAGGFGAGRFGWQHDPFHRAGIAYPNRGVAARFNSSPRFQAGLSQRGNFAAHNRAGFSGQGGARTFSGNGVNGARSFTQNRGGAVAGSGWQRFGNSPSAGARSFAPNRSFAAPGGFHTAPRGFAAPQPRTYGGGFNAPPRGNFSQPGRSFGGPPRGFSGGGPSAPRSFGGGSRSFGGGGRAFSGGGGGHAFSGGGGGHSAGGGHGGRR